MLAFLASGNGVFGFAPMCRIQQAHCRGRLARVVRGAMSDYGTGMDQAAMMESDMLVVVDQNDVLIDGAVVSKRKAHEFTRTTNGTLHIVPFPCLFSMTRTR